VSDPVQPRPQPVLNAAKLGGLVAAAFVACGGAYFLITQGVTSHNLTDVGIAIEGAITALIALAVYVTAVIHGKAAQEKVTPLSAPRDHEGRVLVPDPSSHGRHAAGGRIGAGLPEAWALIHADDRLTTAEQVRHGLDYIRSNYSDPLDDWPSALKLDDTQEIPRVTEPTVRRIPEKPGAGRLGRHVRHDPRSLSYLVPETTTPTTAMWTRRVPVFDQGNTGSCTGNAAAGVLGTSPFYETLPAGLVDDEREAVSLYSAATALDDYPGTYPPTDTGSDGLSVAKAAQKAGLISGYQHITSVAAAQTAIISGPFIVGCNWWTSMDSPDGNGLVKVSGTVRGGHEFACHGYDATADLWWFTNSWGTGWGKDGKFCMSSASFAKLLADQGDATVFLAVAPFPPQPPAPVPPGPPAPTPLPANVLTWARMVVTQKWRSHHDRLIAQEIIDAEGGQ
jgi:hypothetical protein